MGYKVSKKGHRNCSRNTGYKSHIIPFTNLGPHSEGKVRVRVSKDDSSVSLPGHCPSYLGLSPAVAHSVLTVTHPSAVIYALPDSLLAFPMHNGSSIVRSPTAPEVAAPLIKSKMSYPGQPCCLAGNLLSYPKRFRC